MLFIFRALKLLISCAIFRPVHIDKCYADYGLVWCFGREVDEDTPNPGGNFVDVSLCVAIKQATGTLMSFQPDFPHGTTKLAGAHNRTCAITFSEHIFKAYEKAMGAGGSTVESGAWSLTLSYDITLIQSVFLFISCPYLYLIHIYMLSVFITCQCSLLPAYLQLFG